MLPHLSRKSQNSLDHKKNAQIWHISRFFCYPYTEHADLVFRRFMTPLRSFSNVLDDEPNPLLQLVLPYLDLVHVDFGVTWVHKAAL